MTDDLDALKSALRATPAPDAAAKYAALALAMDNFDRLQGSTDAPRLFQDHPSQAGFLNGVRTMLMSLKARPYLAATTSAAALLIGVFVALPSLQPPAPVIPTELAPPVSTPPAAPPVTLEAAEPALTDSTAAKSAAPSDSTVMADSAPAPVMPGQPLGGAAATRGYLIAPGQTAGGTMGLVAPADPTYLSAPDTEAFANAPANPVIVTAESPVSTFSVDVDTASYAVIRSSLTAGQLPPPDAVRIEEMVNYFPYDYPSPTGDAPFANMVTVMPTPWNPDTRLVHIALQGQMPAIQDRPPLNLVFLIDTSGSMGESAKLPLLIQSFTLMLAQLNPQDQIAIVAYAGSAGQVLSPTAASDRPTILRALNSLASGGSTAGAEGLTLAYRIADDMAAEGRVSRVILATDGDFNVGIDSPDALKTFIATQADKGTYLSVLGFGRGNLDDATMQALAQNGNGTAAYIDTLAEAQKVLVDQLTGALFPIANDVKVQVEWNPAQVAEYRLIGYETRALRREDFNNDKVDAGEIGAGLQVTALYEVTAPNSPALLNDPLRYTAAPPVADSPELGFLRLRYKAPGSDTSKLIETPITLGQAATDDARFAAAIAGFGQLLQSAPYLGDWDFDQAIQLATATKGPDPFGYRAEAVTLMRLAQSLSAR
jgi:Ca-activated chloride channel family protein